MRHGYAVLTRRTQLLCSYSQLIAELCAPFLTPRFAVVDVKDPAICGQYPSYSGQTKHNLNTLHAANESCEHTQQTLKNRIRPFPHSRHLRAAPRNKQTNLILKKGLRGLGALFGGVVYLTRYGQPATASSWPDRRHSAGAWWPKPAWTM